MLIVPLLWEGSGSKRGQGVPLRNDWFSTLIFSHDGGEEKGLDHLLQVFGFFQGQC